MSFRFDGTRSLLTSPVATDGMDGSGLKLFSRFDATCWFFRFSINLLWLALSDKIHLILFS